MSISEIYKKVSPDLLSESNRYRVVFMDTDGRALEVNGQSSYEVTTELKNPFGFDPISLLPNFKPMDLGRFFTVASEVIANAEEREGIQEDHRIKLYEEYQPEDFAMGGDEVISFKVIRRYPAEINGRTQRKAGYEYQYLDAKDPNKTFVIEGRPIDHEIEFSIWSKTATLANKRALWLEKLFSTHSWAFIVQGVERFYWLNRGSDTLWKTGEQRLHQRPLRFFVRLREFEVLAYPSIKSITIEYSNIYERR